jgi:hypothetical protein
MSSKKSRSRRKPKTKERTISTHQHADTAIRHGDVMNRNRAVAYHEAGHAVAAVRHGIRLTACEMMRNEEHGGIEFEPQIPDGVVEKSRRRFCHKMLVVLFAGPAAEMKIDPHALVEEGDSARAKHILNWWPEASGIGMFLLFHAAAKDACELVIREWPNIKRVGDALLEQRTLSAEKVHALCDSGSRANP